MDETNRPAGKTLTRRAAFMALLGATALPFAAATAQPMPSWWEDRRRREAYERWRATEWRRRERDARRRQRTWRRDMWREEREREAWASRQPWNRR
jgi:hypothetical protein